VRSGFRTPACTDEGLAAADTFWYTVEAANDAGSGPCSPPVQRPVCGPRAPDPTSALVPGLACEYFEGSWNALPDFAALTPVSSTTAAVVGLPAGHRPDGFAVRLWGFLAVEAAGEYTFHLASDDGSRLRLGEDVVVDNDGLHGTAERSQSIPLQAGKHALSIEFFERDGGETLELLWSGPGFSREPLPAAALWHAAPAP
jgi:hypothetical protein